MLMLSSAEKALYRQFGNAFEYGEHVCDNGETYGFFLISRKGNGALYEEDLIAMADAVFATRADCKWFGIIKSVSGLFNYRTDCGEIYRPSLIFKKTEEGDVATCHIVECGRQAEMLDDMCNTIADYGPSAIGITHEQYQAGVKAFALHRARKYVERSKIKASESYDLIMEDAKKVEDLLGSL